MNLRGASLTSMVLIVCCGVALFGPLYQGRTDIFRAILCFPIVHGQCEAFMKNSERPSGLARYIFEFK